MIDYDAIMAGRLGAAEKAGLAELAEVVETGEEVRRGSREGMSDMLPLMRRYDTRCFALEVPGDGEEEEELEERLQEQRHKRKQQQEAGRSGAGGEEEVGALKKMRSTIPLRNGGVGNEADADAERVGMLMVDLLKGQPANGDEGKEKEGDKRSSTMKKRVKKEEDGSEASIDPKEPMPLPAGPTVLIGGNYVTLPHNWRHEEESVTSESNDGSIILEKINVFVSPEGIACFDEEMIRGCESTRTRPTLNFQRTMHLLKTDVMKLAKQPQLSAVSGKALGRDSVVIYRRGMVLLWKKLGLLRESS